MATDIKLRIEITMLYKIEPVFLSAYKSKRPFENESEHSISLILFESDSCPKDLINKIARK